MGCASGKVPTCARHKGRCCYPFCCDLSPLCRRRSRAAAAAAALAIIAHDAFTPVATSTSTMHSSSEGIDVASHNSIGARDDDAAFVVTKDGEKGFGTQALPRGSGPSSWRGGNGRSNDDDEGVCGRRRRRPRRSRGSQQGLARTGRNRARFGVGCVSPEPCLSAPTTATPTTTTVPTTTTSKKKKEKKPSAATTAAAITGTIITRGTRLEVQARGTGRRGRRHRPEDSPQCALVF
jgi:hypothetical protein